MPNGFPAFRHDPTKTPRYTVQTANTSSETASRYTDSPQQTSEPAKLSKYQYPTERGMRDYPRQLRKDVWLTMD